MPSQNDYLEALLDSASSVKANPDLMSNEKDDMVQALSDQFDSMNNKYAEVLECFTEIAGEDFDFNDTINSINDSNLTAVDTKVNEILTAHGLSYNQIIALDQGFVKLGDAMSYVGKASCVYADSTINGVDDALTKESFDVKNAAGQTIQNVKISAIDILDSVKKSLHSSVATAAAISASIGESISDKYNLFTDKLGRFFDSTFSDISGMVSFVKDTFKTKFDSPFDYVSNLLSKIGIGKQADDDTFTPDQSEIYEYTGSSPLPVIDFHFLGSAFETVGKAIGAGLKIMFGGIVEGLEKVTNTIGSAFENTAYIGDLEQKPASVKNHTIENWFYSDCRYPTNFTTQYGVTPYQHAEAVQYANTKLNKIKGKWIIKSNMFRQVAVYVYDEESKNVFANSGSYPELLNPKLQVAIKPKLIDPAKFQSAVDIVNNAMVGPAGSVNGITLTLVQPPQSSTPTVSNVIEFKGNATYSTYDYFSALIAALQSLDNIYLDIENRSDETDVLACWGLFIANAMGNMLDMINHCNIPGDTLLGTSYFTDSAIFQVNDYYVLNKVSNADLIYQASGLIPHTMTPTFELYNLQHKLQLNRTGSLIYSGWNQNRNVENGWVACANLIAMYNTWMNEFINGSAPFAPYCVSTIDFRKGGYRIRTDSENEQYARNFLTTIIAAVTIAVVAITALIMIKRIQFKRRWKRAEYYGKCDAQTWAYNFEVDPPIPSTRRLTFKEKRKYDRYKRRDAIDSGISAGLVGQGATSIYQSIQSYNNQANDTGNILGEKVYTDQSDSKELFTIKNNVNSNTDDQVNTVVSLIKPSNI